MKLKIWHNSNIGNPHFERDVPDVETAKAWLKLLADYDLYQDDRVVANAQGLMVWNGKSGEWEDWEREPDGASICEVIDEDEGDKLLVAALTEKVTHVGIAKRRTRKSS